MLEPLVVNGVYRHYEGELHRVFGVARHFEHTGRLRTTTRKAFSPS
jgi:hypothetical protein